MIKRLMFVVFHWPLVLSHWSLAYVEYIFGENEMVTTGFKQLRVYRQSEKLANVIWEMVNGWDYFSKDTVGKQLVRSADSIGANLAEGARRGSYQDNRRFIRIARGSLYQTEHWLRCGVHRKLLTQQQVDSLKPYLQSLPRQINAYLSSIGTSSNDQ